MLNDQNSIHFSHFTIDNIIENVSAFKLTEINVDRQPSMTGRTALTSKSYLAFFCFLSQYFRPEVHHHDHPISPSKQNYLTFSLIQSKQLNAPILQFNAVSIIQLYPDSPSIIDLQLSDLIFTIDDQALTSCFLCQFS